MGLIDGEKLKQKVAEWLKPVKPDETVMVALDDIAISVLMTIEEQPVVPAIQIDRIKQLRERVALEKFSYSEGSDYCEGIMQAVNFIDNMLKEYEAPPTTPKDHKTSNDQQRSPEVGEMDDYMTDCRNCRNRKKCMEYMGG